MKALVLLTVFVACLSCQKVTKTSTDALVAPLSEEDVEIFQKAFWKRPNANDKILHAERREWSDGEGIMQWQWFLVVAPSSELVLHLRVKNAFGLVASSARMDLSDVPDWFSFDRSQVDLLQAPRGNLRLAFSKTENLLFATDMGGGFRESVTLPAPESVSKVSQVQTGRLPLTSPPRVP